MIVAPDNTWWRQCQLLIKFDMQMQNSIFISHLTLACLLWRCPYQHTCPRFRDIRCCWFMPLSLATFSIFFFSFFQYHCTWPSVTVRGNRQESNSFFILSIKHGIYGPITWSVIIFPMSKMTMSLNSLNQKLITFIIVMCDCH